jgi:hypothetical protein
MQDEEGNDKQIEAFIKRIPVAAEGELDNMIGSWSTTTDQTRWGGDLSHGTIKNIVMKHAIKYVNVDGKKQKINFNNPYRSLPDLRDDETGESITEWIVKCAIKENQWVGQDERYALVFARYLSDDAEDKNPTNSSSTNGSSSTSLELLEAE